MAYLESKNYSHRDLAARNILMSRGNIAKIADFGLSKMLDNPEDHYAVTKFSNHTSGVPKIRSTVPYNSLSTELTEEHFLGHPICPNLCGGRKIITVKKTWRVFSLPKRVTRKIFKNVLVFVIIAELGQKNEGL